MDFILNAGLGVGVFIFLLLLFKRNKNQSDFLFLGWMLVGFFINKRRTNRSEKNIDTYKLLSARHHYESILNSTSRLEELQKFSITVLVIHGI